MRTIKLILIVIVIFSLISAGDLLKWSRYHNREYGFSLILPRFWEKQEGFAGTALIALSPQQGPADKFRENITVTARDLPAEAPETTLDAFFELNKAEILRAIPGIKSDISENEVYAGREKGKQLMFENRAQGVALKIISAAWVKAKRLYSLTCVSEISQFKRYAPVFKVILRSFRIK